MTPLTKGQITVYSVEETMNYFERADYKDCRINAYPAFSNKAMEKDYERRINLDFFSPNILFIDIDMKDFESNKAKLDKAINRILKHISQALHSTKPLLLWSGRGYHIIVPVKAINALEKFEEFDNLTKKPSEEFLRFAKSFLSFDKADKANSPSFKSCLLRVPYTFNSKCIVNGRDPEVKIVQGFDKNQPLPKINNLVVEFMTFLSDKKLKEEITRRKIITEKQQNDIWKRNNNTSTTTITYIEKLLELTLDDFRKNSISLILAPYFVNVLNLSDEESFAKIKQWSLKCNNVKPLEPSIRDFDILIITAIKRAKETGIKPLKFKDTLQYKNKQLYEIILSSL